MLVHKLLKAMTINFRKLRMQLKIKLLVKLVLQVQLKKHFGVMGNIGVLNPKGNIKEVCKQALPSM